jgi:4-hydroxy-tetrahydrodipicolinate synthase
MSIRGGLITALITPFKDDGSIDFDSLESLVEQQVAGGVEGFVISGTTAESPNLSPDEIESIFKAVKGHVPDDFQMIIGAGNNSTSSTVERIQRFDALDSDGFLIVVPYYNKPTQAGMIAHFKEAAAATKKDILLYDVPGRTIVEMSVDTVVELSSISNIVGIKDATGNLEKAKVLKESLSPGFLLLSGDDGSTVDFIKLGGHGAISVLAHVVPKELKASMKSGEGFERLAYLCSLLFSEPNPTPVKRALKEMGVIKDDQLRLPLLRMTDEGSESLLTEMIKVGLC